MMKALAKSLYNLALRPLLPRKIASFNGVPVRQPRLFDLTDVRPNYEAALVESIRQEMLEGDQVVLVGGGWGVSSVVAAREIGPKGSVTVYEGNSEQVAHIQETARLSRVEDLIEVHHSIVGEDIRVYGQEDSHEAEAVTPEDLPDCDALILDCEGAEPGILRNIEITPRVIIVETHHMFGAPVDASQEPLEARGYEVTSVRKETTPYGELPVLTAVRD